MAKAVDVVHDEKTIGQKLANRARMGLYRHVRRFGLRRVLADEIEQPQAKISIHVRPFEPVDKEALFGHQTGDITEAEALEIKYRLDHLDADIPTPYVAIDDETGTPCYIQWLMGSEQNDKIQSKLWGLPRLAENEALLENAYTPPAYRGQRIMPAAMYQIALKARDIGADYALTFVTKDNMASLKGCKRAGFSIYMVHDHRDYAFGLYRNDAFTVLSPADPRLFVLDT